jgi:hypothetical protein
MSTPTRFYRVDLAGKVSLVKASSAARALHHVTRGASTVRVATQDDLVELLAAGVKAQIAGESDGQADLLGD